MFSVKEKAKSKVQWTNQNLKMTWLQKIELKFWLLQFAHDLLYFSDSIAKFSSLFY